METVKQDKHFLRNCCQLCISWNFFVDFIPVCCRLLSWWAFLIQHPTHWWSCHQNMRRTTFHLMRMNNNEPRKRKFVMLIINVHDRRVSWKFERIFHWNNPKVSLLYPQTMKPWIVHQGRIYNWLSESDVSLEECWVELRLKYLFSTFTSSIRWVCLLVQSECEFRE